jgi:hypothetical protein
MKLFTARLVLGASPANPLAPITGMRLGFAKMLFQKGGSPAPMLVKGECRSTNLVEREKMMRIFHDFVDFKREE